MTWWRKKNKKSQHPKPAEQAEPRQAEPVLVKSYALDAYVDDILKDENTNIILLPDGVERFIYRHILPWIVFGTHRVLLWVFRRVFPFAR